MQTYNTCDNKAYFIHSFIRWLGCAWHIVFTSQVIRILYCVGDQYNSVQTETSSNTYPDQQQLFARWLMSILIIVTHSVTGLYKSNYTSLVCNKKHLDLRVATSVPPSLFYLQKPILHNVEHFKKVLQSFSTSVESESELTLQGKDFSSEQFSRNLPLNSCAAVQCERPIMAFPGLLCCCK